MNSSEPREALPYMLHRLAFILQRQTDELLQTKLGLGFSQFKLMIGLEKHPDCEQRVLANFLGQTEASVSRQMKVMQDMNLVEVLRDRKDNRRHHVQLTAKGRRMLRDGFGCVQQAHAAALQGMDDREVNDLCGSLRRMLVSAGAQIH